jgi:hypothetical protein
MEAAPRLTAIGFICYDELEIISGVLPLGFREACRTDAVTHTRLTPTMPANRSAFGEKGT